MAGSHAAPPETLDRDLDVGPEDFKERDFYQLMTGMIIPRPIGWIGSVSADGVPNLAPFSQFTNLSYDPPMIVLSISDQPDRRYKDTVRNLNDTREMLLAGLDAAFAKAEAIVRALLWLQSEHAAVVNISLVGPPNLILQATVARMTAAA